MKKILNLVGTVLVLSMVFAGCKTTTTAGSGIKGKAAKMGKWTTKLVDYQGATFGKEIPEWVTLLSEGQYSSQVLSKSMPGIEGKKVFVTIGRGNNLEFVRNWTDLVDVEVQVGDTFQRVVTKGVQASMNAKASETGKVLTEAEVQKKLDMYKAAVSLVELTGLEKTASYWIEAVRYEGKKAVNDYFEYYAVWTMDKKLFDKQIKAAMATVDDNTSEGQALKDMIRSKLMDSVVSSNDVAINNVADDYVVYGD